MPKHSRTLPSVLLATMSAAVLLAGCSSPQQSGGTGMMPGTGSSPTTTAGHGMMGPRSDYHYSRLTCSAPNTLPGKTVTVTLGDMGMTRRMGGDAPIGSHMMLHATPATLPAGKVSLVALNMGWRVHELVILPLSSGRTAGQRVPAANGKVDETGSLGEASASCAAGTGTGIAAGTVGWTTVTLEPGRYELICNLANHYVAGMYQDLVVT
jgi:uncharacterized cupredoxin-like copper-binding protein